MIISMQTAAALAERPSCLTSRFVHLTIATSKKKLSFSLRNRAPISFPYLPTPLTDSIAALAQHLTNDHSVFVYCSYYTLYHLLHTSTVSSAFWTHRSSVSFSLSSSSPGHSFLCSHFRNVLPLPRKGRSPTHNKFPSPPPNSLSSSTPSLTQLFPRARRRLVCASGRIFTSENSPVAFFFRKTTHSRLLNAPLPLLSVFFALAHTKPDILQRHLSSPVILFCS